jgi:hypothetical protein
MVHRLQFQVILLPLWLLRPLCNMGDDDDKSSLFSHDQRLAQGEEAMVTT